MKSPTLTFVFFMFYFYCNAQFVLCSKDSLELNARNYGNENIQWQISTDGGTSFTDIPDAVTPQFTVYPDNGDYFRLKVVLEDCDTVRYTSPRQVVYPCRGETEVTYNGVTYPLIETGCQCWMGKDLQTGSYNDGEPIDFLTNDGEWLNAQSGAYAPYDLQESNALDYGYLYNWFAVNTEKLCPQNWRVPDNADWKTLVDFIGSDNNAGGRLKETGTLFWNAPNTGASDDIGFGGRPGGMRNYNGGFFFEGTSAFWWSATSNNATGAFYRSASSFTSRLDVQRGSKENGFSVRCMRD